MFRPLVPFAILFALSSLLPARGSEIIVPDHYPTICQAMDAAFSGDTIIVRPGTYVLAKIEEHIRFGGKAVHLKSERGPEVTVIEGSQIDAVVSFNQGEDRDSILEGFTIRNGKKSTGGGINISGTLHGSVGPSIIGNIIEYNHAQGSGGGIGCIDCLDGVPLISGNIIRHNTAQNYGGGFHISYSYNGAVFVNNVVWANAVLQGEGGGLSFKTSTKESVVTNNTIVGNSAATGTGGGIWVGSSSWAHVANTIVWDNLQSSGGPIAGILDVSFCDVQGGWPGGSGNIDQPPHFADPSSGDFHLRTDSPCKGKGTAGISSLPATDFEGDPRNVWAVDIGADERFFRLYRAGAAKPGHPIGIRVVGQPGQRAALFLGWDYHDWPLKTQYGEIYLTFPWRAQFDLGTVPASGIRAVTATLPPSFVPGTVLPFQAVLDPWAKPSTRITNLMVLYVE